MSDADCVQVAVRVRPLVESEEKRGCHNVINKTFNEPQIVIDCKEKQMYTFNHVFTPDDSQEKVYISTAQQMLAKLFEGYNVTILAYGQTGSGKTHTMGTAFDGNFDDSMGVIPRAITDIFQKIDQMPDHKVTVCCSFMELYQEQLYDLLNEKPREQSVLDIREDSTKKIIIPGLTEIEVKSPIATIKCLTTGSAGRATGATAMNAVSSRSHAIFTITIRSMKNSDPNGMITARFHLVDLAGSERSNKTKATGDRFKEGVKINQGLLALGNVISALGSGQNVHIAYRDSKLTRLLQDSLGGNSVTLMIVCVSPADYNLEETLSALRYADRARKIKNKPIVNQDTKAAELIKLQNIIEKLKLQLMQQNGEINYNLNDNNNDQGERESLKEIQQIKNEINIIDTNNIKLQHQIQTALSDVVNIETRAELAEGLKTDLIEKINELKKLISNLNSTLFDKETCPAEFYLHKTALHDIQSKINDLNVILDAHNIDDGINNNSELENNEDNNGSNHQHSIMSVEDAERKIESSTTKQIGFSNDLKKLNMELALKEELYQKIINNMNNSVESDHKNLDENLKDYETIIQKLEKQRNILNDKLKNLKSNNFSAKIAEERRKKLQELDQEINEMKKKNLMQSKLIKSKEKDSVKINILETQIRELKNTREKLVNSMKHENKNFQLWKKLRDKELNQLKEKEEKAKTQVVQLNKIHEKQQDVLKRKMEEANAIKNKLKENLEKQKNSQNKKTNNNKTINIDERIKHEIDVILSVVDAKLLLEQLMVDRGVVYLQLAQMKSEPNVNKNDITNLEDYVDFRNAQITDLCEKTISLDVDDKIKTICDNISSLNDFKISIKNVLTSLIDTKTNGAPILCKYDFIKSSLDNEINQIQIIENDIKQQKILHEQNINSLTRNYEEKTSVLLRELNKPIINNDKDDDHTFNMQEKALDEIDLYRENIEILKKKNSELKRKFNDEQILLINQLSSDSDNESNISTDNEMVQPKVKSLKQTSMNFDDKELTLNNKTEIIKCNCKGNCLKKICECKKNHRKCDINCKCIDDICQNNKDSTEESDDDNENEDSTNNDLDQTPVKRFKKSYEILDVTTPSYPYSMKKRKPFFDN